MQLRVTKAQSDAECLEAYQLVKDVYAREFSVDLDQLRQKATLGFRSVSLLIRDERQTLVGTASLFYPTGAHLFPSEYLFGANIRRCASIFPLGNTIEVGRLAKAGIDDRGLIVKATMLAVDEYLRQEKLAGWIATVKPPLKRILRITGLTMQDFTQSVPTTDFAGCLAGYATDISCFRASADDTHRAFQELHRLREQGVIRLDLSDSSGQKQPFLPGCEEPLSAGTHPVVSQHNSVECAS